MQRKLKLSVAVGKWLPLMHTASGYIFLSSLSSDALKEILISEKSLDVLGDKTDKKCYTLYKEK